MESKDPRPLNLPLYRRAVGRRVERIRKSKGISQATLAKLAKISQPMVSRLESGGGQVGLETIRRISQALGVELDDLAPDRDKLNKTVIAEETGERIHFVRLRKGMRIEDLAKDSHIPLRDLVAMESGEKEPTEDQLELLGAALKCDPMILNSKRGGYGEIAPRERILFGPSMEIGNDALIGPGEPQPPNEAVQEWRRESLRYFLREHADRLKITKREIWYLQHTQFDLEPWVELNEDFWSDLLAFWRVQMAKGDLAYERGTDE